MRFLKKIKWKEILSIGLAALVLFGAVGAVASFATNDSRTIGFNAFEIGALSEVNGQYKEDKTAIYTKEAIECQGLKVKPEFDSDVTYQIFWYNEDELYLDCTQKTTLKSAQFVGSTPELAKYARIVIFPSQLDEEGKQIKDFKVSIFDIAKIANNLNITVNKEQEYKGINIFENLVEYEDSMGSKNQVLINDDNILFSNHGFATPYGSNLNEASIGTANGHNIVKISCDDTAIYKVDLTNTEKMLSFFFYDISGAYVSEAKLAGGDVHHLTVPNSGDDLIIIVYFDMALLSECTMTRYLPRN